MAGQGFASMSKQRLKAESSKGGKTATNRGTKHAWGTESAKAAGAKGAAVRKHNLALEAALRLVKAGFNTDHLNKLKLTEDEFIYFAGRTARTTLRWAELKSRIEEIAHEVTPIDVPGA